VTGLKRYTLNQKPETKRHWEGDKTPAKKRFVEKDEPFLFWGSGVTNEPNNNASA